MPRRLAPLSRAALLIGLCALICPAAAAQSTVFLRITGIAGDVQAAGYVGTIDVSELHHLVTGTGAATHESFVFVKARQEHSTVDLWTALDKQTPHDMSFLATRTCSASRQTYYEIALRNARVVAIEPWYRDGGVNRKERVRIDYDSISFHFFDLDQNCAVQGDEAFELPVAR